MMITTDTDTGACDHPLIFMFGGQGCHYFQMGRDLLGCYPAFDEWMDRGEAIFSRMTGGSLLRSLYSPSRQRGEASDDVVHTHASIFVVEYALAATVVELGHSPDLILGYSLGEFAGAAVAGLVTFDAALGAVLQQAMSVRSHCEEAGMTAVLAEPRIVDVHPALFRGLESAAVNWSGQFVVAGSGSALSKCESGLRDLGIASQRLPVRFAFHSTWMEPLRNRLVIIAEQARAAVPFISCTTSAQVEAFDAGHVWRVLREPVRFASTVADLSAQQAIFLDVSPTGTLSNFVTRMPRGPGERLTTSVLTPFLDDTSSLRRALQAIDAARPGMSTRRRSVTSCT